jgi:hypothetical protein
MNTTIASEFYLEPPEAEHPTRRKIRGFADLAEGWHYGEGGPISTRAVDAALGLHAAALRLGFTETNAFPGLNGEIEITLYTGPHYIEFIIERDCSVSVAREFEDRVVEEKSGLRNEAAYAYLLTVRKVLWSSSELSVAGSTMRNGNDSRLLPFGIAAEEFPSSTPSAQGHEVGRFVGIYASTTQRSPTSPLFIGAS